MNPFRDESSITLGSQRYVLRPTFEALAQIEGETGLPILELASRFSKGKVGTREITAIISAGIRGAGGQVPGDLGELIMRAGLVEVIGLASLWLTGALSGEGDPSPEKEPVPGKA